MAKRTSLPSRERGLKCKRTFELDMVYKVAPFTGAWIEMRSPWTLVPLIWSLPSRERGLKYVIRQYPTVACRSLPSRERGLKYPLAR